MQITEPAGDRFDPAATAIDYERLAFAQRQRVMAFLSDSAHYLGLTAAGSDGRHNGCCPDRALPLENGQLTAGVRGC